MPRLRVKVWGVLTEFAWGMAEVITDEFWNKTDSRPELSSDLDLETILKISGGGVIANTSKEILKNVISDACFNLRF